MVEIEYGRTGNGRLYCKNYKDFLEEAELKGLTRSDIANIAEVDPSTVRNWLKLGYGSLKPVRKLKAYLDSIGSSIKSSALKEERVVRIARWLEEGNSLGFICLFALSNEVK